MTKKVTSLEEGKEKILSIIKQGKALKRFAKMCICQGVTPEDAEELCFGNMEAVLGTTKQTTNIYAKDSGINKYKSNVY